MMKKVPAEIIMSYNTRQNDSYFHILIFLVSELSPFLLLLRNMRLQIAFLLSIHISTSLAGLIDGASQTATVLLPSATIL